MKNEMKEVKRTDDQRMQFILRSSTPRYVASTQALIIMADPSHVDVRGRDLDATDTGIEQCNVSANRDGVEVKVQILNSHNEGMLAEKHRKNGLNCKKRPLLSFALDFLCYEYFQDQNKKKVSNGWLNNSMSCYIERDVFVDI